MIKKNTTTILCPLCGIKFTPQTSNICPSCTLASLQNTTVLSPAQQLNYCIYCLRYQRPPWIHCERESAQLLGVLLKKIKGLSKFEMKDAKFIWTQPHSKRIKVKVDFIRIVDENSKVKQTQVVQFVQKYTQCPDCKKNFTPHEWGVLLQIRHHTDHKRTLLNLQQNLTRQKWMDKALNCEAVQGGLDIQFKNQQDAHKCLAYIKNHLPVSHKVSKQLVSHNQRDNKSHVKTSHALIIPKICKDDLILIHPKWCKQLGNCSPLLLCLKVTSQLYFLDPTCNRKLVITPTLFFALEPYADIFNFQHFGRKFVILDNEGKKNDNSHNTLATWGILAAQDNELKQIYMKSHLNCEPGDEYMGYTLENWCYIKNMPDYILVKRLKSEQELQMKRAKKDKKRKQQRLQKKKQRQQSIKQLSEKNKEQQISNGLKQQTNQNEDWVDASDDDQDL